MIAGSGRGIHAGIHHRSPMRIEAVSSARSCIGETRPHRCGRTCRVAEADHVVPISGDRSMVLPSGQITGGYGTDRGTLTLPRFGVTRSVVPYGRIA
jgi:hypothetical protein